MTPIMRSFLQAKRRKTEPSSEESEVLVSSNMRSSASPLDAPTMSTFPSFPSRRFHHRHTGDLQPLPNAVQHNNRGVTLCNTDNDSDLSLRPPKFKHRSPFYQSSSLMVAQDIRMILIEAESRVIYDTATVIPVKNGIPLASRSVSACGEFHFLRRKKDTVKLSQMIFGAVPSLKGSESFRIHVLEDEEKILVSKTFAVPKGRNNGMYDSTSSYSDSQSVKSLAGWRAKSNKSIMTTPEGFSRVRHISIAFGDDDNDVHFGSSNLSASLPRTFSPPHRISKARRRQLAVTTSLSEISGTTIQTGLKARSRLSSLSSSQNEDDQNSFSQPRMRNLALGILVPIRHRSFLMQHIPLIEAEMSRFEARIVTAAGHAPTFLSNIFKSWEEITEVICELHNAPRLQHPYWLALNEKCQFNEKTLATEFCEQLAYLVRRYDRKEAGYFLSNLVTAILMHHMSWVASVASPPLGHVDRKQYNSILLGKDEKEGAITVGYNAHMAQYLEISGACGTVRSAKTYILGNDVEVLASVCSVLSFFIRCSAVQHIDNDDMWEVPTEHSFSPMDMSTSSSGRPDLSVAQQIPSLKPEETSSVAMMRRLRNNNQNISLTNDASSCMGQSNEINLLPDSDIQEVNFIDKSDFPCCPTISKTEEMWIPRQNSEGLGRSMFAGPLDQYCSHFVLSAIMKSKADLPDVYSKMLNAVSCTDSSFQRTMPVMSSSQLSASVCDTTASENIVIVADIEELSVTVLSSEGSDEVTSPSESVVGMLEQFVGIHDAVPATAEFLVGFIEDSLAHIVGKSLTLVELVRTDRSKHTSSLQLTPDRVRSIIGCDHSDLRLIIAVAAVYWPPVLQSVLG